MNEDRKHTIYMENCGCMCPQLEPCPHMNEDGACTLEEPWFDCDDFMYERADEIAAAEDDIADEERRMEEEDDDD